MLVYELINVLKEMDPNLPARVAIELENNEGIIREIKDITIEGSDTDDSDYDVLIEV